MMRADCEMACVRRTGSDVTQLNEANVAGAEALA